MSRTPLADYVSAQIDVIITGDAALRDGDDPIHDTRVAIRRLRSVLRVFSRAFDRDAVAGIDAELRWFAVLLGEVRDCQVQRRRFAGGLDGLPDQLILGPVKASVDDHLLGVELPARAEIAEAMDSDRYGTLLSTLRGWRTEPPIPSAAVDVDLTTWAKRAGRKADGRLATAVRGGDGAALHRARKAAKRARYAAEVAGRRAKHYKKIQSVLGDHQDAVVAAEVLLRLAESTGTSGGHNGFTFGLLYAREQRIAAESRRAAGKLA